MKKKQKQRIDDALNSALAPPKKKQSANLNSLLAQYAPPPDESKGIVSPNTEISHPFMISHTKEVSLTKTPPQGSPMVSLDAEISLNAEVEQATNLAEIAASATYRKGNLRINRDYMDQVISRFGKHAQLLYIWILRFRDGTSNRTIRLKWATLVKRTGISTMGLYRAALQLENAGLVARVDQETGKGKDQGFKFSITHAVSLTSEGSLNTEVRLNTEIDSNIKDLKEHNKKGNELSLDTKNCPDCDGMGVRYIDPLDYSKGTVKCKHEKLKPSPDVN